MVRSSVAGGLVGTEAWWERSSLAEGLGDGAGLRSSAVEGPGVEEGAADVALVEFCGRRTVFAGDVVPVCGPFRVCTFTARAADPVRRIPAAVRTMTVFVLMTQP